MVHGRRPARQPSDGDGRFTALFHAHFRELYRYVRRRAGTDVAEEVASETFERAFRNWRSYQPDVAEPRAWLYGIATNLLRHHFRHEERQLRAFARTGVDPVTDELDPSWWNGSRIGSPRVAGFLADLPSDEREALLLYAWADLSYRQIADCLGIPLGTVRSRLNRARTTLRACLADEANLDADKGVVNERA